MLKMLITIVALMLAYLPSVGADSWPSAEETGVVSPDGRIVVRMIPGESLGEVHGYGASKIGKHAIAKYYRLSNSDKYLKYLEVELKNPIEPVFLTVANSGALVTLDNWHNMGYGNVLTIYSSIGAVVNSFTLSDIYSPAEIKKIPASVSSIWWRCFKEPILESFNNRLTFYDVLKNIITVDLETGKLDVIGHHEGCDDTTSLMMPPPVKDK